MASHTVFNGVDQSTQSRLEEYWAKKLPRLQRLLTNYRHDLQDIRLTVYRHPQSPQRAWYEARAVIHLPTGTLAAEANDKEPLAALDQVADTLVKEIKRHEERLRHDHVFKRKARERANVSAAGPLLQRDAEAGRREDFFQLLRPLLRFLRGQARRELRAFELQGNLHPGEVTVADVLDEVLKLAWERFPDRPKRMPLELWLTNLLHEVLEGIIKQEIRPHTSLQEKVDEHTPEEEWWAPLLGYEQSLTVGDLIPDSEGTPWDELEAEEENDRLLAILNELPTLQRQAFLLHVLEDYDVAEIAMLQDRPESEVKADIETARRTLKERLSAGLLAAADQEN